MKAVQLVMTLLMFAVFLPVSEAAIRTSALQHDRTEQTVLDSKKTERNQLKNRKGGHRLFHKKRVSFFKKRQWSALEIITLIMAGLTIIVFLNVKHFPSTLWFVVVGLFFFTLLLAFIGVLTKKKEGQSKSTFIGIIVGGLALLAMFMLASSIVD